MRLFIPENPSFARTIAKELRVTRGEPVALIGGDDTVTWCFGYMLDQAEPDKYTPAAAPRGANGRKRWREEDRPITTPTSAANRTTHPQQ
jgi:DNA topoisomerase-3